MLGVGYKEWPVSLCSMTWNYCVHMTGLVWSGYLTGSTLWISCIICPVGFTLMKNTLDASHNIIGQLLTERLILILLSQNNDPSKHIDIWGLSNYTKKQYL